MRDAGARALAQGERMRKNRDLRYFQVGALSATLALLTAWAVDWRHVEREQPAAEALVEEATAAVSSAVSWDLPVTRNDRVEKWIDFLSGRNRDKTELWIARSGRYAPMIRERLRERGMPEDLVYLAFIESGFSPKAYSRAHAAGIWQFIEETGERYGLEVSSYVDERRDPVKATDAALSYLEDLYEDFGSWYLAAAAYNTGENRVRRILRERAGGARGDDDLFWRIASHLPRETRDYVPLMLAAGHIGKEPEKFGFEGVEYHQPLRYESVMVPGGVSLRTVAKAANVDADDVADLNPHLVRGRTPPDRRYPVRLPVGRAGLFAMNFEKVQAEAKLAAAAEARAVAQLRRHTVRRGETLSHLAKRYGTTVAAISATNGDLNPRRLRAGQVIRIPGTRAVAGAAKSAARPTRTTFYTVRRGDTLSEIAVRNDVSVRQLQSWNSLGRRSVIRPGQRLRIRT